MRICFISIDVERDPEGSLPHPAPLSGGADGGRSYGAGNFGDKNTFYGVENLDNILDVFRKHKVAATLFVNGDILEHYHNLVLKWSKDYEIGCHNYVHISLDRLDFTERERQLKRFISVYNTILGKYPKGFRAPRNIIDNKQFEILERYNFIYDSSVVPRHIFLHKYKGYKGRAPIESYHPSNRNYRKKGEIHPVKSREAGTAKQLFNGVKILEIPNTPLFGGIPFAATWIRRLGVRFFKSLLKIKKPKFLSLTMHSWDGIRFEGRSSKNSGERFLKQLDEILGFLKKIDYEFRSGEEIAKEFLISNS